MDSAFPGQLEFSDKWVNIPTARWQQDGCCRLLYSEFIIYILNRIHTNACPVCCASPVFTDWCIVALYQEIMHVFKQYIEQTGISVMNSGKDSPLWTENNV